MRHARIIPFAHRRAAPPALSLACRWSEAIEDLTRTNLRLAFAWQRVLLRSVVGLGVLAGLTGCSTLDYAGGMVRTYCAATSEAEREVIRERFNAKTHPHEVLIYCVK